MSSQILLFIIKLILGGIVAFLAILLMSKTRDAGWMFMVAGFILSYAAMLYELLIDLGVLTLGSINLFGIPVTTLICTAVPSLCFIIAFIIMLCKKKLLI